MKALDWVLTPIGSVITITAVGWAGSALIGGESWEAVRNLGAAMLAVYIIGGMFGAGLMHAWRDELGADRREARLQEMLRTLQEIDARMSRQQRGGL